MDLSKRDIIHLLDQHAFNSRDRLYPPKALPDRLLEDYPISPQCNSNQAA
jgi:hypothetical protein